MPLLFKVASFPKDLPKTVAGEVWLLRDNWDDWGKFETLYHLFYYDKSATEHRIGDVKFGRKGLIGGPRDLQNFREGVRYPGLPAEFTQLPEGCFSLGQDASYYQELMALAPEVRRGILHALRDLVADKLLWEVGLPR